MPVFNNVLAGSSGQTSGGGSPPATSGYTIERSLRFEPSDSAYLSKTFSSAGNRRTWTFSCWVKRTKFGTQEFLLNGVSTSGHGTQIEFDSNNRIHVYHYESNVAFQVRPQRVLRDPAAWYHIVVAFDTTQSNAADRVKIYINGVLEDQFLNASYPGQNTEWQINNSAIHYINAKSWQNSINNYTANLLCDAHFIDGQALQASDFGETDASTGVWKPKQFSGSFSSPAKTVQVGTPSYPSDFTSTGDKTSDQTGLSFGSWSGSYTGAATKIFKASDSGVLNLEISLSGGTNDRYIWSSDNGTNWTYLGNLSTLGNPYKLSGSKYYATSEGSGSTTLSATSFASGVNSFRLNFSDNTSTKTLGYDQSVNPNPNPDGGMAVVTYTGNGSTQNISTGFQPDFVWFKQRSGGSFNGGRGHELVDSVRGLGKALDSSSDGTEFTSNTGLTAYNSDGFTIGSEARVNENNASHVAWAWKAGGAASLNENGSIDSQVSVNNDYGFSIVTYTGTANAETVGHGLSAAPSLIIAKCRTQSGSSANWAIYSSGIGASNKLYLNGNIASTSSGNWNSTSPTSSVFSVGGDAETNRNGQDQVAYCWKEVSGFSKFSSYNGNGSTQKITFGFKPKYVLIKRTDSADDWYIFDDQRVSGTGEELLRANTSAAENTAYDYFSFDDDGITLTQGNTLNGSGRSYVYAAFGARPGNNFDVNNLSVAAGADNDSLLDTPTNYDDGTNVGGNFCTWNPLDINGGGSTSDGNLKSTMPVGTSQVVCGTIQVTSGKWYWEAVMTSSSKAMIGVADGSQPVANRNFQNEGWYYFSENGKKYHDGTNSTYGATFGQNDVIGVALDMDAGTLTFYKNGVSQGVAYSTGLSGISAVPCLGNASSGGSSTVVGNFGQRAFQYPPGTTGGPSSDYKSLCTQNLSATITNGKTAMDVTTYTGNGSSQSINDYEFEPDLLWIKETGDTGGTSHYLSTKINGVNKSLQTNSTQTERTDHPYGYVSATTSNGFTVTNGSSDSFYVNGNNQPYVAWAWNADTAFSNSAGTNGASIASSGLSNASAGFSIVKYTANGTNSTVFHNLNAVPELVIIKGINANVENWKVYHKGLGSSGSLHLNLVGYDTSSTAFNGNPTSNVFGIGTHGATNQNTKDFLALCFTSVEGYSKVGSYTGNASATDPTFVYLGFKPRFLMVKGASTYDGGGDIVNGYNWFMYDSKRSPYNEADELLAANKPNEQETAAAIDFLSNGFKIRNNNAPNAAVTQYFIAFAEHPFSVNGGLAR